jgi:tetratricopeptide (TPR) repeat protein
MLAFLGRRDDALAAIARARAAQPDSAEFPLRGGLLLMDFDCDLRAWQAALDALPAQWADDWRVLHDRWFFSLTAGDYQQATGYAERMAMAHPDEDFNDQLGWTYALAGRPADAAKHFRPLVQRALVDLREQASGDAAAQEMAYLARAYAFLGDRANAISYANRAVAALPPAGAFRQRPPVLFISGAVLALAGEIAAARELYRQLLELPFDVKPSGIWCDPMTAPMRADPAFRAMMAEHGADVSIDPHRRETWPKPAR